MTLISDRRKERIQLHKITCCIDKLCYGLDMNYVNPIEVTQKVVQVELDVSLWCFTVQIMFDLTPLSETAAYLTTRHPDYAVFAARIVGAKRNFTSVIIDLYEYINPKTNKSVQMVLEETYRTVMAHKEILDCGNYPSFDYDGNIPAIIYNCDFSYNYFGCKTLERSYLIRLNGRIAERPQYMMMRVAVGIHGDDIEDRYFTHATSTLFNAGTPSPQMSSCIYDNLKNCGLISKSAGGCYSFVHVPPYLYVLPAVSSYVAGTNGYSNGIVPMFRAYNATGRYGDQGGNKLRARDLLYVIWIPDVFRKRVEGGGNSSLFCPSEVPGLHEVYGDEFEVLYECYEREGRAREIIPAQKLWYHIFRLKLGTLSCSKSNQKNLAVIKPSNLCTEIVEYSSPDETAVCNLASLALPTYIVNEASGKPFYGFQKFHDVTKTVAFNLNRVIDRNYYPIPEVRRSNMRKRPIGIRVQGPADGFMVLKMSFDLPEANEVNTKILETIYHGACETHGPYETWMGSRDQQGQLQLEHIEGSKYGMRNLLLTAPMPTACTSQMLGFNECFEPYTSLFLSSLHTRAVLAGEFQVLCPWLLRDLVDLGLWDDAMKNMLIVHHGSVQNISAIPNNIESIYKTVWEISQKKVVDVAADRGVFIWQSQSLNVHLGSPTMGQLTSMYFYGWKKGLKTGMYYLRTKPAAQAIQFTVNAAMLKDAKMHQAKATAEKKVNFIPSKAIAVALAPAEHSFASSSSSGTSTPSMSMSSVSVSPSPITSASDAAKADPEFAAALLRQNQREYEEAKLLCSIENKEACLMCSG
ncbi:hypothetical protein F5877DRAFT_93324 [Lentinula edodes]|nr:hypothetical protein F5877DRAFT_93324 [Lentinula edodes]